MSEILPQYPSYYDTDPPEEQLKVVRSYLSNLKGEIEVALKSVKLSDMDEDTQKYFADVDYSIEQLTKNLTNAMEKIESAFVLVRAFMDTVSDFVIDLENVKNHALLSNNNDSLTSWFKEKNVTFQDINSKKINADGTVTATGTISSTGGNVTATYDIAAGGNIGATGDIIAGGDLSATDDCFVGDTLQVGGQTWLDGQLVVGSSQQNANAFIYGQLQVKGRTYCDKDVTIYGKTDVYGQDINAFTQTEDGVTTGGHVMALEGFKTQYEWNTNKYYHKMSTTINGETVYFLGYKDSDFPTP